TQASGGSGGEGVLTASAAQVGGLGGESNVGSPALGVGGMGGGGGSTSTVEKNIGNLTVNDNGSISNTGPNCTNKLSFNTTNTTTVSNDNDIHVSNWNTQNATSGDAKVSNNTNAGDA